MSEDRTNYTTKLTGRGGPGRGQGAKKGNTNAAKKPGQVKRVKISITVTPATLEKLRVWATLNEMSLGRMIDRLVETNV